MRNRPKNEKKGARHQEIARNHPGNRVCLISEEPIVISILQGFISDLGYRVVAFRSASDLLAEPSEPIGIILIDLDLPGQKSIDTIRAIHERFPDTYILVITSNGSILPSEVALSNDVYAYVSKPVRLGELELLLARVLEKRTAPVAPRSGK